ncbi:hypothetical protein N007_01110 [Alicyclobacillus acidoterrestris ATCC 49025]|nr:hypothetical protein N007_01110 [Alicyclobacillus acidoterrestris ATCC 49025]
MGRGAVPRARQRSAGGAGDLVAWCRKRRGPEPRPGSIVHVFCLICDIAADSGYLVHEFYLMPGKSAEIGAQGGE